MSVLKERTMVKCCIPHCSTSGRLDPSVSFHTFPSNPDTAAKWIRNINLFIPDGGTWFPQPADLVCSRHFLQTDFRPEMRTPSLKPRGVPTVFSKTVSFKPSMHSTSGTKRKAEESKSPLIVKVMKPTIIDDEDDDSEMDDTPLTELLRDRSPSSFSSATNSSSITSFSPISRSFSRITSFAESQSSNISTCTGKSISVSEVSNTTVPKQSNVMVERVRVANQREEIPENTSKNDEFHRPKEPEVIKTPKTTHFPRQKKEPPSDLIEIGPTTFLKINPEVIKVTKKVTQSGNTVLQFMMNPNLGIDCRNVFQPVISPHMPNANKQPVQNVVPADQQPHESDTATDGQKPEESSTDGNNSSVNEDVSMVPDTTSPNDDLLGETFENGPLAPVVLSTTLPINHSFGLSLKQRHASAMRQKNRQIHALKAKLDKLLKRVDELETKCIVQERQLDFPSLKKLKAIKKNADKSEAHASFILEQIRGYFGNIPLRWSDTTMTQCSIWCRKAPYAYEYFKKADLFRLPCLGTVKRYMKKHPEITTQIKNRTLGVHSLDSDSSSDFDFDEDEDELPNDEDSMNGADPIPCDAVLNNGDTFPSEDSEAVTMIVPNTVPLKTSGQNFSSSVIGSQFPMSSLVLPSNSERNFSNTVHGDDSNNASTMEGDTEIPEETTEPSPSTGDVPDMIQSSTDDIVVKTIDDNNVKSIYLPTTSHEGHITTMNLNGQEIILQPGNIIQLNSDLGGGDGMENQFFVIPSADDQSIGDHQYSVAQPVSFVIQDGDNERQVIYITENTPDGSGEVSVSLADSNL